MLILRRHAPIWDYLDSWIAPDLKFMWVADYPTSAAQNQYGTGRTIMRADNGALVTYGGIVNAANGGPYLTGTLPFSLASGSPYFIMMLVTPPAGAISLRGAFLKIGGAADGLAFGAGSPDMDVPGTKVVALREAIAWHVSAAADGFVFGGMNVLAAGTFSNDSFRGQLKNLTTGVTASITAGTWNAATTSININGYSTRGASSVVHAVAVFDRSLTTTTWDAEATKLRTPVQSLERRPLSGMRVLSVPRRIYIPTAAAAATAPSITALSAINITATSAQPRISYS